MGIAGLPELMLSGNFPEEIHFQWNTALVSIYMNGELLLEEEYTHAGNYLITLRLRELLHSQLETLLPAGDITHQEKGVADFQIHYPVQEGTAIKSFRLVKGGIDSGLVDATSFLRGNFLTWMPRVKKVKYLDPQWLTYYAVQESRVMVQATWVEGTQLVTGNPVLLYDLPTLQKSTFDVKFQRIWDSFYSEDDRAPYYIDVWIEDEGQDIKTYKQRYVLSADHHEFDDLFGFENSLGGYDIIRFTGEKVSNINHEFKSAVFLSENREYDIIPGKSFDKSSGYFKNGYELLWSSDFLSSVNRYHYLNGFPVRIRIESFEASSVSTELNHFSFKFTYSKQSRYLDNNSIGEQISALMAEFSGMQLVWDDIYVRIFGDQTVDGVKTFIQPVKTNEVKPATGDNLVLNDLVVQDGGIIDCGEF